MTIALIDGDILAYKAAIYWAKMMDGIEDSTLKDMVLFGVESLAKTWLSKVPGGASDAWVAVSGPENFRKRVLPSYKANRDSSMKPLYVNDACDHLLEVYQGHREFGLEADDLLAIWQKEFEDTMILSEDKDLIQCGGKMLQFKRSSSTPPILHDCNDPVELARILYTQWIVGDRTDNLMGGTRLGPVKAQKLLANCQDPEQMKTVALKAIVGSGVKEQVALAELRCITMVDTWEEWDELKGQLYDG